MYDFLLKIIVIGHSTSEKVKFILKFADEDEDAQITKFVSKGKAVIGHSATKKDKFIQKFVDEGEGTQTTNFVSTIAIDFKIKTLVVGGKVIKLKIWATAGEERFRTINYAYYRGAHGLLLLYDVSKIQTFDHIKDIIQDVSKEAKEGIQMVLVGNNCHKDDKRQISTQEGQDLADKYGISFMEASVERNINVERAFVDLTQAVIAKNSCDSWIRRLLQLCPCFKIYRP